MGDLPDIENEFNILIPFELTAADVYPENIVIAFFN